MQLSLDPKLQQIAGKVEAGERLTFEEGIALYNSSDLNAVEMIQRAGSSLWKGTRSITAWRQCKFVVQFCEKEIAVAIV